MLLSFVSSLFFVASATAVKVTIPDNLHLKFDVNGKYVSHSLNAASYSDAEKPCPKFT